jgi:hypothetical protein
MPRQTAKTQPPKFVSLKTYCITTSILALLIIAAIALIFFMQHNNEISHRNAAESIIKTDVKLEHLKIQLEQKGVTDPNYDINAAYEK